MRLKLLLFSTLLMGLWFTSCSGLPKAGGGGGGGGTGSLSMTLVADSRPANPAILSLRVTITGIALTRASGSAQNLNLAAQPVIDLARLDSDTAFLGTFSSIPAGQYTGVSVTFANPVITFLNDTGVPISPPTNPNCPNTFVCQTSLTAAGTATANVGFTVASTTPVGVGLDFNLGTAVSVSGGTLSLIFTAPNAVTAFSLPRTGSNLSAGQLDLIEDFTGVASLNGQAVTITSPTRGTLTATATSTTNFDASPYPARALCSGTNPTLTTCVANSQIVSADAIVKSNGTLSLQEIEPLVASQQDILEGTVFNKASTGGKQFLVVVTDKQAASANSLISSVNPGDLVTINLSSPNTFLVDTKGLAATTCCASSVQTFLGSNTDAIHVGQTVALHVTAFTPPAGSTLAAATVDTAILRWSRFIATATGAASTTVINVMNLPSNFNFTSSSIFAVQAFTGTPGGSGVTNLDGLSTAANVLIDKPVSVRALYFLTSDTVPANPPFLAAKLRQH